MRATGGLFEPRNFRCEISGGIARIAHDRPERKNPFTFDSYAELREWFPALGYASDVHAVVILPNEGNFSSGGDVHDIIGPLTRMTMKELLAFTRMTGDLVKAMIHCGKPVMSWCSMILSWAAPTCQTSQSSLLFLLATNLFFG